MIEIPPNWEDVEEELALAAAEEKGDKGVSFRNIRGAAKKTQKNDLGPVTGTVIARVEWEGDFETL